MCESIVEKNSEINVNSDTAHSEKPKRNAAIEICRIVCIVMVVFNHTFNPILSCARHRWYICRYVNLLNVCAVGTFFIITGFYLFQGHFNYKQRLKKLLFEILLPALCVLIVLLTYKTVRGCVQGKGAFFDSLRTEFFALGKNLLSWKFSGEYGYLWFILAYTEMIVFYPVYYLLCKDEKISNAARRLLMVFCFMRILLEDFTRIAHLDFPIRTFSLIGAYQLFLLLGFELKLLYDKGKLSKRFCLKSGLVLYFFGVILAALYILLEKHVFHGFTENWYHLNCHTSILSAAGLFLVFLGIEVKGSRFVYLLGRSVFYVYLVQTPIHIILKDLQLNANLFPHIGLLSFIVIALLCILVSFAIGTAIVAVRRIAKS